MSLVHLGLWFMVAQAQPSTTWVPTEDGAHVALHRYEQPGRPAVLLCHGISSNSRFWDLDEDHSLALYLHDAGFDVWNMDLRGHGVAEKTPEGKRVRGRWSIDDYGHFDMPAAIAHVRAETGGQPLHFVGHSMGGMVFAIYLASRETPEVSSAVIVASPLDFEDLDRTYQTMGRLSKVGKGIRKIPTPFLARVQALFGRATIGRFDELVYNPENLDPKVARQMLRTVVSPLYGGEVEQFQQILATETFTSLDGDTRYQDALGHVELPMLFFAGRADRVVSPDRVRGYFEAVGSTEKSWIVLSKAGGASANYGHLDFGVGLHATEEVFEPIARWLRGDR